MRALRLVFAGALVAGLVLASLLGVIAIISEGFGSDDLTTRVIFTPVLGVFLGGMGMAALLTIQKGRLVLAMRVLLVLVVATVAFWAAFLWVPAVYADASLDLVVPIAVTLTAATMVLGLSATPLTLETRLAPLRAAAVALVAILVLYGLAIIVAAWTYWSWVDEREIAYFVGGGLYFAGPVLVAAIAILPALARVLERRGRTGESMSSRAVELTLTCPGCRTEQRLGPGPRRCRHCRLGLVIEVEEPRCACGYLLFRLEGNRCPECGLEVSAARS